MILNIWQGNGVLVVVRERENLSHGEGEQLTTLIQRKEDVRDIMRSPDAVLNSLQQHATEPALACVPLWHSWSVAAGVS